MSGETTPPDAAEAEKKRAGAELRKLLDDAAWTIVMRLEELIDERVRQVMVVDDLDKKLRIDRTAKLNLGYTSLRSRLSDALVELLRRLHRGARTATSLKKDP